MNNTKTTIAAFILLIALSSAIGKPQFAKRTGCGDLCSRAFCIQQKIEECNPNTQVFIKRDGDCYCCDFCMPKGDVAKSARAEIEQPRPFFKRTDCGTICQRVRCAPAKKEECHPVKEVFVERDGDCYCCDTCAPRVQVSSLNKKCEANFCDSVKCHDVPANDCFNKGMAYMPKDGDCSCCDQCESL